MRWVTCSRRDTRKRLAFAIAALAAPACDDAARAPAWEMGLPKTADVLPTADSRGLRRVRGIIHLHSVYSHDACDGEPLPNGRPAQQCFQDLRDGLCRTHQDFALLTDHAASMCDHDWEDLFVPRPGDEP